MPAKRLRVDHLSLHQFALESRILTILVTGDHDFVTSALQILQQAQAPETEPSNWPGEKSTLCGPGRL